MAAPMACRSRACRSSAARGFSAGAAARAAACSMSSRLIAPPTPVPRTVAGSTPSSAASFRASGEILSRPGGAGAIGAAPLSPVRGRGPG